MVSKVDAIISKCNGSNLPKADWKAVIVITFLAIQLALVIWARFIPERWFCWAPHDSYVDYELTVIVNGKELTDKEISQRFVRDRVYREVRAAGNAMDIIKQHCRTYGKNDETRVIMNYKINGIQQEPWIWHHIPEKI